MNFNQVAFHESTWTQFGRILWQMEDDLNTLAIGRRPQYLGKWKTTLRLWQMEDNLKILI